MIRVSGIPNRESTYSKNLTSNLDFAESNWRNRRSWMSVAEVIVQDILKILLLVVGVPR